MNDEQFYNYMQLLMVSDPWPVGPKQAVLDAFADEQARMRGYKNWIEAYHSFTPIPREITTDHTERSKNLKSTLYRYDDETMDVTFQNGGRYRYYEIPPAVYKGLQGASSPGEYFASEIRGKYRYERI